VSAVLDDAGVRTEVRAFIQAHHVMSLATMVDGAPHAASLMYAAADFSLYWTSDPGTRHSMAIEREARVAATIAPDYEDFRVIRGLQIAGRARRLGGAGEIELARKLMCRRFAFLREMELMPETLRRALDRAAYYRLDPEAITWIDNTRGFGSRHTLRIDRL
jgi:uncharacterized protein YhbP (UPF0306 family)